MHKREADELLGEVERIEKSNLGIMSELFECTVDDLKISRWVNRRTYYNKEYREGFPREFSLTAAVGMHRTRRVLISSIINNKSNQVDVVIV